MQIKIRSAVFGIKCSGITNDSPIYSKLTYQQRYAIEIIVEKLNTALLNNNKMHLVKKLYDKHIVLKMVNKIKDKYNCDYDEAINRLNKQLQEQNFDIYKP